MSDTESTPDYRIVLKNVLTVDQSHDVSERWGRLIREVFTSNNVAEKIRAVLTPEQTDALEEGMKQASLNIESPDDVSLYLKEARKALDSLPKIRIVVATTLPERVLVNISNWFVQMFTYRVLLEVIVESELIGGVRIEHGGVVSDYSLRSRLHRMMESGALVRFLE